MKLQKLMSISLFLIILIVLSCTRDRDRRENEVMNDMYYSYAIKAQEEDPNKPGYSAMKLAPKNTQPRNREIYSLEDPVLAGKILINPLPMDKNIIDTGKKYYDIYCMPCHGKYGAGDGNIITKAVRMQRMPKPPELYTQKLTDFPDGQLMHIISKGQGNMPAYANRIDTETRWAIVNYVRVLQHAAKSQK